MFSLLFCRRVLVAGTALSLVNVGLAQPAADPIEGTWTGTVPAPQGGTGIGFAFTRAKDGRLHLAFHMPAMFTYDANVGPAVRVEKDVYTLLPFNTRLQLEGDRLTGTFGLSNLPIALHRGGAFSTPPPDRHWRATPCWSAA